MSERDEMLVSLVKELLGPRDGPSEHLPKDRDPRSEYITGVLAPDMDKREDDPDADVDEVIEEVSDDENLGAEGVVIAPASAFSPALDPKSQPRTMGLTFVVTAEDEDTKPMIDICVSWARYTPAEKGGWQREPQGKILNVSITEKDQCNVGLDVDLYIRPRPEANGYYRVSLYLVNQRSAKGRRPQTSDYVFQPQIRVCSAAGSRLEAIEITPPAKPADQDSLAYEDAQLAMLYRDRVALARGHMCGALWKEIDPERAHGSLTGPDAAPFAWTDRSLFTPEQQARFSQPDVRTEFIPSYPIEAPEWNWRLEDGTPPQLDPLTLAQTWSPEDIHARLNPLVEGYERWIDSQRQRIPELNQKWKGLATDNLNQCQQVAQRIREGIEWLVNDEEVRLAFCFANRAIALQSEWARNGEVYPWRTFQLAFILLNISAIADPTHSDRQICDLLWFPTGGGKTEAYLGVAAFTLALRRRRAAQQGDERAGAGVGVLSRYTLRLLTIQQFRRALGLITACEVLRVENLDQADVPTGWRPPTCSNQSKFLWGGRRFSLGLWVGQNVTPNNMLGFTFRRPSNEICYVAGALAILQGVSNKGYKGFDQNLERHFRGKQVIANGDPAQVLTCPACHSLLAISEDGLLAGQHTLHFMFTGKATVSPDPSLFSATNIQVDTANLTHHESPNTHTLSITFTIPEGRSLEAQDIDRWWYETIRPKLKSPYLLAARPARPGYFLGTYQNKQGAQNYNNFEIYCPNPKCSLNQGSWAEQIPVSVAATSVAASGQLAFALSTNGLPATGDLSWQEIPPAFRCRQDNRIAARIPIPAYTTDDQVYHRCPSLVVATVDKFARLAFEPKASSLFGNVSHYHARWGYYRDKCPPDSRSQARDRPRSHPPGYARNQPLHVLVPPFQPPDLIIQDELHLIEGPLGSMVGLYETAIDALCEASMQKQLIRPKYVASTATVRQAEEQVKSLFNRTLCQFPPSAIDVDDRFFARDRVKDPHPLESNRAGRLYVAVAAPGKGAQTPIVRIWSALLEAAQQLRSSYTSQALDGLWTLVGYFNALRELAGANALYRQDIRERIGNTRQLNDQAVELSSRTNSMRLPGLLKRLEMPWGEDAVLATSMFGTGVDVNRLGLMVVHGQPKTTSAYIQATGRVGRRQGGLVVTFLRASRPRDLDHYEFFTGYHRMLYRFVEPITVTPFAPRARERGLGPLAVALLRQAREISGQKVTQAWRMEQKIRNGYFSNAILMAKHRRIPEVEELPQLFEERAQQQPEGRRPPVGRTQYEVASELDRWRSIASNEKPDGGGAHDRLVYNESTMLRGPQRAVILGDPQHQLNHFPVAFENAPNSLRDVEEATHFKG